MIWLAIGLLALAALSPLAAVLARRNAARSSRDLALDLYRAQLAELDRDLAESRVLPAEHTTAVLEVQRRLLAAAAATDAAARPGSSAPLLLTAMLVPAAALGLYLIGGTPDMPSVTEEAAVARSRAAESTALLNQLRGRLALTDPNSRQAWQSWLLVGNAEEQRGNPAAAAEAWGHALAARFDPMLAVRAAFASARAEGALTTDGAALLRRALVGAPNDAPWKAAAEEALRQSGL